MSLEYIKKLNSLVAEGFFVNDLIFMFKKDNKELTKHERYLLEEALKYFRKIKKQMLVLE